ncbi:AAA family ATPase [Dyadobacter sp. OTU695]|uniref:AAA family ATPase n=1 Tax=Dyadobacter sp. OTU695 TaxID=3043860 RepID=UPI00313DF709
MYAETIDIADFNLQDLFYTVSLNYAHFALNSRHLGDWINYLFHKNDAYQQPLVLNPHRNEGNIDVNEEESFANARLLSNILFYDADPDASGKIAMFRELTDKQSAEEIELSLEIKKLEFLFVIDAPTKKNPERKRYAGWDVAESYWGNFVAAVELAFGIPTMDIDKSPVLGSSWADISYKYILRKAISISLKYKKYKGEYIISKNSFKDLPAYLENLKDDSSHVTYKFKQAINFLKFDHLRQFLKHDLQPAEKYSVPVDDLSIAIFEEIANSRDEQLKTIHMIPPSFLKPEITLSGNVKLAALSSGEKQKIFAAGTIAYHLLNIDSGNNDDSQVGYKFVNIIFDEIELYYHPEMQRTFISYLLKYISQLPLELAGLNLTFVTHSPFILSDIPSENIAFLGGDRSGWNTFGANIHDMLADSFFLDKGVMGEYVKGTILSLSAFLAKNELIDDFAWTREAALDVIRIIGEPVIQKQLQSLWIKKYKDEDRLARIEQLQIELKELQDEKDIQ